MTDRFRTHGLDVVPHDREPGVLFAFHGTVLVGDVSPWVRGKPDRAWYARRCGETAVKVAGRHQALAHMVGGCPDCVCDPDLCETNDSGTHCDVMNCGYCLYGCSEDLCPVGEKARTR